MKSTHKHGDFMPSHNFYICCPYSHLFLLQNQIVAFCDHTFYFFLRHRSIQYQCSNIPYSGDIPESQTDRFVSINPATPDRPSSWYKAVHSSHMSKGKLFYYSLLSPTANWDHEMERLDECLRSYRFPILRYILFFYLSAVV